ncbi:hypothetical protein ABTX81_30705 [Kitasatospora sp. NPDC097605]
MRTSTTPAVNPTPNDDDTDEETAAPALRPLTAEELPALSNVSG